MDGFKRDSDRALDQAIAFLRMTAIELRRLARQAPAITEHLRQVSNQLDAEADHLSRHIAG
jgi:hypothetical protein